MEKRLTTAKKLCGIAYLILLSISFALFFFQNSMVLSIKGHPYFLLLIDTLMTAMILFSLFCLVLDFLWLTTVGNKQDKKKGLLKAAGKLAILALTVVYYGFNSRGSIGLEKTGLCLLFLFAITAEVQNEKTIFTIGFCEGFVLIAGLAVQALLGLVENVRGVSFGLVYGDEFSCFLMVLVAYYCIVKNGYLTWLEEIGFLLLDAVAFFVKGRTGAICLLLILYVTYYRHYRQIGGVPFQDKRRFGRVLPLAFAVIYLPVRFAVAVVKLFRLEKCRGMLAQGMKYSFLIGAGVSVLLSATYRFFERVWAVLPIASSLVARLVYGQMAFDQIPIRLFGTYISQRGGGGSDAAVPLYFFIDSSYLKLLFEYGLIAFVLLLFLGATAQLRLYRSRRYYTLFILAVFALDSVIEFEFRYFTYSLYILLAFCKFTEKPGVERCDALSFEKLSARRRWGLGAVASVAAVAVALWCSSAYTITTWRGWTPDYGATLVIPGAYVDAAADEALRLPRLNRAKVYLNSHEDAMCLAEERDRAWLIEQGVEEERILLCTAAGTDELLTSAYSIIETEKLPSRLTVCTYDIEQRYVSRRAQALHVPVNSLTMKVPSNLYLKCFAAEQWRTLWGRD